MTTSCFIRGTLKIGKVVKKTSVRFKDVEAYNKYIDQIQIKYGVDDVVFTGYLIEFYGPGFREYNHSDYGEESDFF